MISKLLHALFLLVSFLLARIDNGVAQNTAEVVYIQDIPTAGVLLNKGWKFYVGDDLDFASAGFDDSAWKSIDPTLDIYNALPEIPENGICWLRIHLTIDTAVSQLVMQIQQSVASEIYLNGKLLQRLGVLDKNPDNVKAFNPIERPLAFPFDNNHHQLLAVRFEKQPGIGYGTHWGSSNPAVSIRLNTVEGAESYLRNAYKTIDQHDYFLAGVFFILGILYMAFYLFYPAQRANLFFSIYAFLFASVWSIFLFYHQHSIVESYRVLKNLVLILLTAGHVALLIAIFELLKLKKDWLFYSLITLGVACILIGIFFYDWGWKVYGRIYTHIFNVSVILVALKSFRTNPKAVWIIIVGGICFETLWLAFTQQWVSPNNHYIFFVSHLSMPLAVSLYLGYDFSQKNRSLHQQLTEIKALSQEKQQILTNQNETLEQQVTERTTALKNSIDELKSAQTQLIQSEKMASLGELTAGIAHEIQNPLNFVNNFSEVNAELIDDLKKELASGNNQTVEEIANNIKENQEKINHHGKRADGIVKSMLQHSRTSSGQKELTDINALCDEYMRLTYHGYRAKDKSFSARLDTSFDSSIPKMNLVRQDIGRVILNLVNNALYAVAQRARQNAEVFEPAVTVTTKNLNDKVEIRIKDNGGGIPDAIKEKIFQPFFTTKPTGQGTGLGLSLAYDIVSKSHGGELKIETKEGEGCEFIIQLPLWKDI